MQKQKTPLGLQLLDIQYRWIDMIQIKYQSIYQIFCQLNVKKLWKMAVFIAYFIWPTVKWNIWKYWWCSVFVNMTKEINTSEKQEPVKVRYSSLKNLKLINNSYSCQIDFKSSVIINESFQL